MMARFPPIPPSRLNPEQRVAHEYLDNGTQNRYGKSITLKNEEGALIGPFAALLYTPSVALTWGKLGSSLTCLPHLTERERELAILAVVSRTGARYPLYAHKRLALSLGLSDSQVECAATFDSKTPEGISQVEAAVYESAGEIADVRGGPLCEESFERMVKSLGDRERVAEVMLTVGFYQFASTIMNVADVAPPEKELVD